ncbi:MAG: mechanosensitive ion channel [Bacteroidales bacterium]|nr:mechanosensitive ion channel [Bacteroidales bacterium]
MKELLDFTNFFENMGLIPKQVELFNGILVALIIVFFAILSYFITRLVIVQIVKTLIKKSKSDYDDVFIKERVFDPISHIVPAILFFVGAKYTTTDINIISFVHLMLYSYLIVAVLIVLFRLLNAFNDIYDIYAEKKRLSFRIKQYIQVLKIILGLAALILIVSIFLNKKPGAILAGLGAMTAVLMLVFKDSILALVASVQISAYKLVKVGDWITVPSKDVDGDVMDISLNTIKIRNFDKTISTIPTYTLVQDSFINWSGMQDSGGRRIKRAINIDLNSIQLCTPEMIEKFKKIHYITDYVTETQAEIDLWNKEHSVAEPVAVNGKSQTNIGIFRKYIEYYLKSNFRVFKKYSRQEFIVDGKLVEKFVIDNPQEMIEELGEKVDQFFEEIDGKTVINNADKFALYFPENYRVENNNLYKIRHFIKTISTKGTEIEVDEYDKIVEKEGRFADDLTILVRQLPSTDRGLPLEVYVFASTTIWSEYEKIQSDLFDHLFAVLPEFGLKVFQQPSSSDFQSFLELKN